MLHNFMKKVDKLYLNIGGKLKSWARWIFVIEAICCFIVFLALLFNVEDTEVLLLLILLLPVVLGVCLVSTWLLYAFGELVERVCSIDANVHVLTLPVKETMGETIRAAEEKARQAAEAAAAEEARQEAEARAQRKAQWENMNQTAGDFAKQAGTVAKQAASAVAKQAADELNKRAAEERARKEALQNYNPEEERAKRMAQREAEEAARKEAEEHARKVVEERMRRLAEEKAKRAADRPEGAE